MVVVVVRLARLMVVRVGRERLARRVRRGG
jgi:hypothetical protein